MFLYAVLAEKLEGESLAMIQNVTNLNGAEVWRKLCRRYLGKTFDAKLIAMPKVVGLAKVKKLGEAAAAVQKWEEDFLRLQKDFDVVVKGSYASSHLAGDDARLHYIETLCQRVELDQLFFEVKEHLMKYLPGGLARLRRCEPHEHEPLWRTSAGPVHR